MHPHNDKRDHKVQHERVADIAKACGGRMAVGGAAHYDVAEDKKLIHSMVKKRALRATGGAVKARSDRPSRAWGGRLGKKKKSGGKGHTVNVIVAPHPPALGAGLPAKPPIVPGVAAMPPGVPPPAGGPPPMPPRPMVPPPPGPMGGPPGVPGLPPGVPPPGMPMRKKGGRVFSGTPEKVGVAARGTDGSNTDNSQTAGAGKGRTPIGRSFPSNKQDTPNIGRGSVITKATGGPVMSDSKAGTHMGPMFTGGGHSGLGRLEKMRRLKKSGYGGSNASIMNPTQNPKV